MHGSGNMLLVSQSVELAVVHSANRLTSLDLSHNSIGNDGAVVSCGWGSEAGLLDSRPTDTGPSRRLTDQQESMQACAHQVPSTDMRHLWAYHAADSTAPLCRLMMLAWQQ